MKHLRPYEEYIIEEANPIRKRIGQAISKGVRKIFGKSKKALPKLPLTQKALQDPSSRKYKEMLDILNGKKPIGVGFGKYNLTKANTIDDIINQFKIIGYSGSEIEIIKIAIKQIGESKFIKFWNVVSDNKDLYEKMTQKELIEFLQNKMVEIDRMSFREFRKKYPKRPTIEEENYIDKKKSEFKFGFGISAVTHAALVYVLYKCTLGRPSFSEKEESYLVVDPNFLQAGGGSSSGSSQKGSRGSSKTKSGGEGIITNDEPSEVKTIPLKKSRLLDDVKKNPQPPTPVITPPQQTGSSSSGSSSSGAGSGSESGSGSGSGSGLNLDGWMWRRPPDKPETSEKGKIVFEIGISSDGMIDRIRPIEYTVSRELMLKYQKEVEVLDFYRTGGKGGEKRGEGTITFIIK